MIWNDPEPSGPSPHDELAPLIAAPASNHGPIDGLRRGLITAALAVGLLIVGGGAAVLAASPDPSASTAPGASTPAAGTPGATQGRHGNCPAKGSGSNGGSGGTSPAPTTVPSSDASSPQV